VDPFAILAASRRRLDARAGILGRRRENRFPVSGVLPGKDEPFARHTSADEFVAGIAACSRLTNASGQ
jgi:hypothetical protein